LINYIRSKSLYKTSRIYIRLIEFSGMDEKTSSKTHIRKYKIAEDKNTLYKLVIDGY